MDLYSYTSNELIEISKKRNKVYKNENYFLLFPSSWVLYGERLCLWSMPEGELCLYLICHREGGLEECMGKVLLLSYMSALPWPTIPDYWLLGRPLMSPPQGSDFTTDWSWDKANKTDTGNTVGKENGRRAVVIVGGMVEEQDSSNFYNFSSRNWDFVVD